MTVSAAPRRPAPSGESPFSDIWFSPRQAIRAVIARDPTYGVLPIAWCAGLALFLTGLASKVSDRLPWPAVVVMAFLLGPLLGFGMVFVASLLTTWTGRLLGGRGRTVEVRAAMAWAEAPMLLGLVLWIPELATDGPWKVTAGLADLGVVVWSEILALVLVAEVHGFSVWRSLAAVLLAWVIRLALLIGMLVAIVTIVPDGKGGPRPEPSAAASAAPAATGR